ncbi:hypothetical protein [Streptomyces sp. NPDC059861]|uniref:hypothetical protein n=1 Tax=Streptomyces sp. NPDC059861 TaxID=3346974 RepID=UPI003650C792
MSGTPGTVNAVNAETAGRLVEEVLDRLAASGDPAACEAAEELVRVLMEFYGAGLARVLDLVERDADASAALGALLGDDLVASLLVLHGLHPEDARTRIARALDSLPQPVENAGFDPATGALRLRPAGSGGCGCGGTGGVEEAAREALACFAPEVTSVEMEAPAREPALLQIGTAPPGAGTGGRSSADAR